MSGHQIILVFNQNYALEITIKLIFGHILYIFIDKLKILGLGFLAVSLGMDPL